MESTSSTWRTWTKRPLSTKKTVQHSRFAASTASQSCWDFSPAFLRAQKKLMQLLFPLNVHRTPSYLILFVHRNNTMCILQAFNKNSAHLVGSLEFRAKPRMGQRRAINQRMALRCSSSKSWTEGGASGDRMDKMGALNTRKKRLKAQLLDVEMPLSTGCAQHFQIMPPACYETPWSWCPARCTADHVGLFGSCCRMLMTVGTRKVHGSKLLTPPNFCGLSTMRWAR